MKSPFPGMDPFIEACQFWPDFHDDLIGEIKRALAPALPDRYRVRTGERNFVELVEAEGKEKTPFYPDVAVTGREKGPRTAVESKATAVQPDTGTEIALLRPFVAERFREQFIEITVDDPHRRLVTCIEVLSPSNKRKGSEGWHEYLRKRQSLLLGEANLVEIDLLRGGRRMPMLDPWPNSPYTMLVGRVGQTRCQVLSAHSLRPLPLLPVPLDDPDPDVMLDLQVMILAICERNRYAQDIDYTKPVDPPLSEAEQSWLREHLPKQSPPA